MFKASELKQIIIQTNNSNSKRVRTSNCITRNFYSVKLFNHVIKFILFRIRRYIYFLRVIVACDPLKASGTFSRELVSHCPGFCSRVYRAHRRCVRAYYTYVHACVRSHTRTRPNSPTCSPTEHRECGGYATVVARRNGRCWRSYLSKNHIEYTSNFYTSKIIAFRMPFKAGMRAPDRLLDATICVRSLFPRIYFIFIPGSLVTAVNLLKGISTDLDRSRERARHRVPFG